MKPLPEELRPLDLKDYVGQEHLSDQLQTLFNSPRLPSLCFSDLRAAENLLSRSF